MKKHNETSRSYPDAPRPAVGAVVFKDDAVLLVQRGNSPSRGMWAIPGGSVHLGETLQAAAEREIFEETGVVIRAGDPVLVFESIEKDQRGAVARWQQTWFMGRSIQNRTTLYLIVFHFHHCKFLTVFVLWNEYLIPAFSFIIKQPGNQAPKHPRSLASTLALTSRERSVNSDLS